jgi:hypothetical protein
MKNTAKRILLCCLILMAATAMMASASITQHEKTVGSHHISVRTTALDLFYVTGPDYSIPNSVMYSLDSLTTYADLGSRATICLITDHTQNYLFKDMSVGVIGGLETFVADPTLIKPQDKIINGKLGSIGSGAYDGKFVNLYAAFFPVDSSTFGSIIVIGNRTFFNELVDSVQITPIFSATRPLQPALPGLNKFKLTT